MLDIFSQIGDRSLLSLWKRPTDTFLSKVESNLITLKKAEEEPINRFSERENVQARRCKSGTVDYRTTECKSRWKCKVTPYNGKRKGLKIKLVVVLLYIRTVHSCVISLVLLIHTV